MRDVNGSRFQLLLGEADWTAALARGGGGAVWDDAARLVTLEPEVSLVVAPPGDRVPALEDRRGAAIDRFGVVHWIGPDRDAILARLPGDGAEVTDWPPPRAQEPDLPSTAFTACPGPAPAPADRLAGLAVTTRDLLVAGVTAPAPGLLAFDLRAAAAPRRVAWPAGVPFAPFDLAATPDGGLVVLDREHGRLWRLDRTLQVVRGAPAPPPPSPVFAPEADAPSPPAPPPPPRLADAVAAPAGAVAVEVAPDGSVLVVAEPVAGPATLHRLVDGTEVGLPAELRDEDVAIGAHDAALRPADRAGDLARLVLADAGGNQAWSFRVRLEAGELRVVLEPRFLPLRRYDGRGLAAWGDDVRYGGAGRWVPLVCQGRPQHAEAATLVTPAFAAAAPGTTWHRVVLDAAIPAGCRVEVESLAAEDRGLLGDDDDPAALAALPWAAEPAPVRRSHGSELPFLPAAPGLDAHELLCQRASGRWCRLRLTLLGDGRATPRLRSLRLWEPRFSYAERYLPAAYREDAASGDLLERFLANPEGLFTELEGRIAAAQLLLAPDAAPAETLPWLAGWLDLAFDPAFGERRRRLFLRHATSLLGMRGTPRGIQVALRLAIDPDVDEAGIADPEDPRTAAIRIVEAFRLRHGGAVAAGDASVAPEVAPAGARWRPGFGSEDLHRRWRAARRHHERFPPRPQTVTRPWTAFCERELGYLPGTDRAADARWRAFLRRRYGGLDAAAAAHGATRAHAGRLPYELPDGGTALRDWHDFGAVVLGAARRAHRFAVLLPVPADRGQTEAAAAARRALAERVVALQKPAHTVCEVRFYWSAFRVGLARLGEDTAISCPPPRYPRFHLGRDTAGAAALGGPSDHTNPRSDDAC
jgi:phage tail-like protein